MIMHSMVLRPALVLVLRQYEPIMYLIFIYFCSVYNTASVLNDYYFPPLVSVHNELSGIPKGEILLEVAGIALKKCKLNLILNW